MKRELGTLLKILLFLFSIFLLIFASIKTKFLLYIPALILFFISDRLLLKSEHRIIKITFQNLVFWIYIAILFFITIYFVVSSHFLLINEEFLKFLIGISFTLGGLTFIGILWNEGSSTKTASQIISSCFVFILSGFFLLFDLSLRYLQEESLFGTPIQYYNFFRQLTPGMSLIGIFLFGIGIFLLIYILAKRTREINNELGKNFQVEKSFKEKIKEFFGSELYYAD